MVYRNNLAIPDRGALLTLPFASLKKLKAEVVFGVTSRQCRGNGICGMYTVGSIGISSPYIHYAPVELSVDRDQNLLLKLNRSRIRQRTSIKYFSGTQFEVEENFRLPFFVSDHLGLRKRTIRKGLYFTFQFAGEQYIIFPAKTRLK